MNRMRLLALRTQVAGVLAAIDAELSAEIEAQTPIPAPQTLMEVFQTMGQPDEGDDG